MEKKKLVSENAKLKKEIKTLIFNPESKEAIRIIKKFKLKKDIDGLVSVWGIAIYNRLIKDYHESLILFHLLVSSHVDEKSEYVNRKFVKFVLALMDIGYSIDDDELKLIIFNRCTLTINVFKNGNKLLKIILDDKEIIHWIEKL